MCPDASMLRKLVRDCKFHPVLRGILESLLLYLMQDLSTRNQSVDKSGFGIVEEKGTINEDRPKERTEATVKWLRPSSTVHQLPEKHRTTEFKTAASSSKMPEQSQSEPKKDRVLSKYRGDKKAGDPIPRRLTTFQLLQSKFARSTPKTSITYQREVGTLSSIRVVGNVIQSKGSEQDVPKRDQAERELRLKKVGTVKNMVAKFAAAEQKERGLNDVMKRPIKPRLIGKGILLSSLMKRFETMATVCNKDLKCLHKRPSGGVTMSSNVKMKLNSHERVQQEVAHQTIHKQNQHELMKSESFRQQLKLNQIVNGKEQGAEEVVDVSAKVKPNLEGKNFLEAEQVVPMGDESLGQKADSNCSFKHGCIVNGWISEEYGQIQTILDNTQTCFINGLKHGSLERLCLMSVTEWSFPEAYRLFLQVEAPLHWHVATVTCRPLVYTCVHSSPKQHLHKIKAGTSEKILNLKKEGPHEACNSRSAAGEASIGSEFTVRPKTEGMLEERFYGDVDKSNVEDPDPLRAVTRLPKYVIPRVQRCDDQESLDRSNSCSQSSPHPQTPPLEANSPSQSDTSASPLNLALTKMENVHDFDLVPPNDTTHPRKNKEEPAEIKQQKDKEAMEKRAVQVEIKETNVQPCVRLSEDNVCKAAFEDSKTSPVTLHDEPKLRPKYTTINYGDPSVKQTYTPKVIRFTDTFTF